MALRVRICRNSVSSVCPGAPMVYVFDVFVSTDAWSTLPEHMVMDKMHARARYVLFTTFSSVPSL